MNVKDKLKYRDRLIHAITTDGFFKVSIIKLTDAVETARKRHKFNPLATTIMGRLFVGTALSASNLKGEERFQFHLESDSMIKTAVVEANAVGEIRGYCFNVNPIASGEDTEAILRNAIGKGYLHSSKILYGESEPVVSSVELNHSNITDDIIHYYIQSEQVPTVIRISLILNTDYSVKHALGYMVQAMPGATDDSINELESNINEISAIANLYEDGVYIDDIMLKILKGFEVKELSRKPVDFFCSCRRERFSQNLITLGKDELTALLSEEKQELVCTYCNEKYVFSRKEIKALIQKI
jgi:molecular chaperone Hsp33